MSEDVVIIRLWASFQETRKNVAFFDGTFVWEVEIISLKMAAEINNYFEVVKGIIPPTTPRLLCIKTGRQYFFLQIIFILRWFHCLLISKCHIYHIPIALFSKCYQVNLTPNFTIRSLSLISFWIIIDTFDF